jgi:hypothetical protein
VSIVGWRRSRVRAGRRARLRGTLWSIDATQAAALANTAIGRMVKANEPVADALLRTGAAANDARAYLFVGPADTKLAAEPPADADVRRVLLFATAHRLLGVLTRWVEATGAVSSVDFVNARPPSCRPRWRKSIAASPFSRGR